MSIKSKFSIKDLENLSGVKAHTIRIWEKRYALLKPERTDTNIRRYSTESLKKILDVAYLYNEGYKISKIAKLGESVLKKTIIESITEESTGNFALNDLKKAMLSFDTDLFNNIYNKLQSSYTFDQIFTTIFIPFLTEIGVLWHSNALNIVHERFITELIKRKTIVHIEQQAQKKIEASEESTFCLFLPKDEIHDIGLLYTNYLLNKNNFNTIFLGNNIPLKNLTKVTNSKKLIFATYATTAPEMDETKEYLERFNSVFETNNPPQFWLLGTKFTSIDKKMLPKNMKSFESLSLFIKDLKMLKKT